MAKSSEAVAQNDTFGRWWKALPTNKSDILRPHMDQLLRLFKRPQKTSISWWHKVGECLLKLFPLDEKLPGMEAIADRIDPNRDRTKKTIMTDLYLFRKFANTFNHENAAHFEKLVGEGRITAHHVRCLVTVEAKNNTKSWREFLKASLKHEWSSKQLQREIQDDKNHLTRYPGRRPQVRTKSNPVIAARELGLLARTWNECHTAYFGNEKAILKRIPKRISKQLLREMETALKEVSKVAGHLAEERKSLESIVDRLTAKLQADR